MSAYTAKPNRLPGLIAACLAIAAAVACSSESPATGIGAQQVLISQDTITGSGQLSELQERRAAWVAREISDYRFQLQISCFCGSEITRPVLVEVRSGAVAKVLDLETGRPVEITSLYPSITALFDKAIVQRSGGGNVSVTYDQALGIPVRLEVGTIANDAGVLYFLGSLTRL